MPQMTAIDARSPTEARFGPLRDVALAAYLLFVLCSGLGSLLGLADSGQDATASAASANQVVIAALLGVALMVARADGIVPEGLLRSTAPFLLALAVAAASPLWSDDPSASIRRAARLVLEFTMLAVLVSAYRRPPQALSVVWRVVAIVAALDIATLAVPTISFSDIGFKGVHSHKNEAGSFALLALPIALAGVALPSLARSRAIALIVLVAVLIVVILSQSKTSAALTVVSLSLAAVTLMLSRIGSAFLLLLVLLVLNLVVIGVWIAISNGASLEGILTSAGIDPTLTGRDAIWRYIIVQAADRPWLGFGYGSFWDTTITSEEALRAAGITFAFGQGHNGYLDLRAQLGWVGMASILIMAMVIFARLFALARAGVSDVLVAVALTNCTSFWLHNITESTVLRSGTDMWVFFVLLMLLVGMSIDPEPSPSSDSARA